MKKNILIIFIALSLKIYGQKHLIGIKIGVNETSIQSGNSIKQYMIDPYWLAKDEKSLDQSRTFFNTYYPQIRGNAVKNLNNKTGYSFGFTYDYLLKKNISLGAEIIYNQWGFRIKDYATIDDFGNPNGNGNIKFIYNYLSVPLKTSLSFEEKKFYFISIGLTPSILVDAKTKTAPVHSSGQKAGTTLKTFDETGSVKSFDLAGFVEIGCNKKIKEDYLISASLKFQQSFTSFGKPNYFLSKSRHLGIILSFGLKYILKNK